MSTESELKAIRASGRVPTDLSVTYDDVHGLWGGTAMTVRGSGGAERRERAKGSVEPKVFEMTVSQEQLLELVNLLVELEACKQQTQDRQPIPDESRATLTVSVGAQESRIWERCHAMAGDNRLSQIKMKMIEMTRSNQ